MMPTRPRVLIIAENVSMRMGGEASLLTTTPSSSRTEAWRSGSPATRGWPPSYASAGAILGWVRHGGIRSSRNWRSGLASCFRTGSMT